MPAPPKPVGSWGYAPLNDWSQGLVADQAPFYAPNYVSGSPMNQAGPSIGPIASDDADDGNVDRFGIDSIRDDDSP